MRLNKKSKALIDINVNSEFRSKSDSEVINILCVALAVSADGTKHYYEALDLIKTIAPAMFDSVIIKKKATLIKLLEINIL
ncbi:hypothetical protein [Pantoea ananatis]|uniref:hypothetical protein n=1 Tax=Pantoea ananas TaxID=553 RepID=UPI001B307065|nr:hypothetical protein [Pantoea ananatis]